MKAKLRKIKMLIMDVDGVMTDGRIFLDNNGIGSKSFDIQDGQGIVWLHRAGLKTAIITGHNTKIVKLRAENLGISEVHQGALIKTGAFAEILKKYKLSKSEICYMGDDFPDMPIMREVGFGVAVKNARPEVKKCADYITKAGGGRGAVREICEMILKAQDKWKLIMERYAE